jgi:hypothetical protein
MDPKPRPNHRMYLEIMRRMTPEEKLNKVFEMNAFLRELFAQRLRERFPDLSEADFKKLLLERLAKCHNRKY